MGSILPFFLANLQGGEALSFDLFVQIESD